MGLSYVQLPVDGAGKKLRTYDYGAEGHLQYVIAQESERKVNGVYAAASFRQVGAASSPINLCTIHVTASPTYLVAVRRIAVDVSVSATTAYLVNSYVRMFRGSTVPSGGTDATKHAKDSTDTPSQANTVVKFGASADGTNSAITYALPSGNPMREQAFPAILTGVGQWLTDDLELQKFSQEPIILRGGESILIASVGNLATHLHLTTKVVFEEFTYP